MAEIVGVFSSAEIFKSLKKADSLLGKGIQRGLIAGGRLIQRLSQQVVPVDTGNLKGGADTRKIGNGWGTEVTVSYSAAYAIYVHERTDLKHKPGKRAKFLEGPARENKDLILATIASKVESSMPSGGKL
jgi:hypothetical protein